MTTEPDLVPANLEPSQLGTKEYWDNYYQNDLDHEEQEDRSNGDDNGGEAPPDEQYLDPSELESWFDDVDAPAKVLEYLTSDAFPLSPTASGKGDCRILDLGTGNGSMLFSLRLEGKFTGTMVGVDYSQPSIDLARKLATHYLPDQLSANPVTFERFDLIHEDPKQSSWWPQARPAGFDLVLDKGTFDAISLSSEVVVDHAGSTKRMHEVYPAKILELIAPGGYFVLTSCNWTEDEVIRWFSRGDGVQGQLEVFGKVRYPTYEFGGQQGQGVASVCFRKKAVEGADIP